MRKTAGLTTLAALALSAAAVTSLGVPADAAPAAGPGADALAALTAHPGAARAADGQEFVVRRTVTDADGTTHVRLDRTYDGLRVLGGDLVVHQGAADQLKSVSQTLGAPLTLPAKASLTAAAAVARAAAPTAVNRAISGDGRAKKTELVVDATGATPRLAWEVITGGMQQDGTPSRLATYVDAHSGAVIRTDQQIVNVDGTGQSLYSGTVPLDLTQSGSSYQLKDASRGNTYTTDLNNAEDSVLCQVLQMGCQAGTTFSSPDTSFGSGSTSSRESAGVDAQYGTDMTWDFYKTTYGRNGIFGDGSGSFNRTHYGQNYVNAFWDGTKMTYGDGDGVDFGPLVSLDVAGHEMSHGVTENTAGLTYSGESGGLNESTSDIFGTMVEFYADNAADPGDYLIGEEFDLKRHLGFRRMDDPSSDGASFNCYTSAAGDADVHYSSGIGNHFFYLLAEGSGARTIGGVAHSSTTCNGSTVAGIGRDDAGAVWFRALDVYMTSSTNYAGARTATLSAATDLYGAGSAQHAAVSAAWSAVDVD